MVKPLVFDQLSVDQCFQLPRTPHLLSQVEAARPYSKYSARPSSVGVIPFFVEKVKKADSFILGRCGKVHLSGSVNFLLEKILQQQ